MQTVFVVILIILLIWLSVLSMLFVKANIAYRKFTKGITKKELKSVLNSLVDSLKASSEKVESLNQDLLLLEKESKLHLQKVGFVRFNPFSDTGGNQSFVLCLLDDGNNGIVITSLHSRDQTRIYAKPVKAGKSKDNELSKEEKEALKTALKDRRKKK